jgi:NADH-quinone oxidoreductase subunit H
MGRGVPTASRGEVGWRASGIMQGRVSWYVDRSRSARSWGEGVRSVLVLVAEVLGLVLPLMIGMAYLTLVERKVMASIQRRHGPNTVGFFGLLTPLADGLKLFIKENIVPSSANPYLFRLAPMRTFSLALLAWAVMPISQGMVLMDRPRGVLYLLMISSLAVYGIMLAGWASNSKYAFLGALRSAAQMVSYEVSIGFILVSVLMCGGSMNLSQVVLAQTEVWYVFPRFPAFRLFMVSALAETNRHPFDLPEAEAELVSGYNVEYSGMSFALFFLGEYMNMVRMSSLTSVLFRGGWMAPWLGGWIPGSRWMGLKTLVFLMGFIWARAAFPRYRFDQLMRMGWKVFLPMSLGWARLTANLRRVGDGLR